MNKSIWRNIFLAFFPYQYWVGFLLAIVFLIIGGKTLPFFYMIMNAIIFFFSFKMAILVHEIGHLVFAWAVGMKPLRLILGEEHLIHKWRWLGIKFVLYDKVYSGRAHAYYNSFRFIKLQEFIYTIGGFVVNFSIVLLIFYFFEPPVNISKSINIPLVILVSNLICGVISMIPHKSKSEGTYHDSDGLSILKIPFRSKIKPEDLNLIIELLESTELLEEKKYQASLDLLLKCQTQNQHEKGLDMTISLVYLKLGEFEKASDHIQNVMPLIDDTIYKHMRGFMANSLAWNYLLEGNLKEADYYSELAIKEISDYPAITHTRAAVLIETGRLDEGIELIEYDVNKRFKNSVTLGSAMYLALAYYQQGNMKKFQKNWGFMSENKDQIEKDEMLLLQRITEKININHQ